MQGDVAVEDGRIADVGLPPAASGSTAVAGYVDLQVNGFAGVDFTTADVAGYRSAATAMAATGVTSFQPTFVTLSWSAYDEAIEVAEQAADSVAAIVGVHLEGPFVSPARPGAHDPAHLRSPTRHRVEAIADHDFVTWVTLAPELDGGLEAVATLVAAGKRVAIGHSDATADEARRAFDRGATAVTHVFNAQSPLHHRAPGIPGAALGDDRVAVTMIVDGHHLDGDVVRLVFRAAAGRVALITDAIAAAGTAEGVTTLGGRTVIVAGGRAQLGDGTLAGSVVTMDQAVRNAIDLGVPLEIALQAATAAPAMACGMPDRADVAPGTIADVVVLDADLGVVRTLQEGTEVYAR